MHEQPEIDAQIWQGDASSPEYWDAAYRGPNAEPHMDRPPANPAIALTLALLRACDEMF